MDIDIAVVYYGMTRSIRKCFPTHIQFLFDEMDNLGITYKKFIHTWNTRSTTQNVWCNVIPNKIDESDHLLINPDYYQRDYEDDYVNTINIHDYMCGPYIQGEYWNAQPWNHSHSYIQVLNYLCMMQSQKRGFELVKNSGLKFKYIMFIRPDVILTKSFPVLEIINQLKDSSKKTIVILDDHHGHFGGYTDRFATIHFDNANGYSYRCDELYNFRKNVGQIVAELYNKYIIDKYYNNVYELSYNDSYCITRL